MSVFPTHYWLTAHHLWVEDLKTNKRKSRKMQHCPFTLSLSIYIYLIHTSYREDYIFWFLMLYLNIYDKQFLILAMVLSKVFNCLLLISQKHTVSPSKIQVVYIKEHNSIGYSSHYLAKSELLFSWCKNDFLYNLISIRFLQQADQKANESDIITTNIYGHFSFNLFKQHSTLGWISVDIAYFWTRFVHSIQKLSFTVSSFTFFSFFFSFCWPPNQLQYNRLLLQATMLIPTNKVGIIMLTNSLKRHLDIKLTIFPAKPWWLKLALLHSKRMNKVSVGCGTLYLIVGTPLPTFKVQTFYLKRKKEKENIHPSNNWHGLEVKKTN